MNIVVGMADLKASDRHRSVACRQYPKNDIQPLRYVLSTGRTGTVFLSGLLNKQAGVIAAHEPDSSRYQMMLANLRNDLGIGGALLKRIFEASRKRRLEAAADGEYVELNPFLCPMADLIPLPGHQLRIVHMVRDPATWARSMTRHKATARFRPIIDHVPFAKFNPAPRPTGWNRLNEYERALWRWNWCNSRIQALQAQSDVYARVRYEDLFADDERRAATTLDLIRATLSLPATLQATRDDMSVRANPSTRDGPEIDRAAAARICGPLARSYGYDY